MHFSKAGFSSAKLHGKQKKLSLTLLHIGIWWLRETLTVKYSTIRQNSWSLISLLWDEMYLEKFSTTKFLKRLNMLTSGRVWHFEPCLASTWDTKTILVYWFWMCTGLLRKGALWLASEPHRPLHCLQAYQLSGIIIPINHCPLPVRTHLVSFSSLGKVPVNQIS